MNFKEHIIWIAMLALFAGATVHAEYTAKDPDPGISMPLVAAGPVAIGQDMLQGVACDNAHPCTSGTGGVALVQAPAPASGGIIQLSAFGWLEPYVDSVVQALLLAGLAALGKSKYTQWMDQSARDALATFTKNTASSLIADGFVRMAGKTVTVSNAALANEVNTAADRIPDAMKRFGLTPASVAQKIVDAIPQTPAGAAIVATAHTPPDNPPLTDPVSPMTLKEFVKTPPTASS